MSPHRRIRAEKIDWARVRRRLARAIEMTEAAERLSPERARAVMDERARALACAPAQPVRVGTVEVVVFSLGGERYAVETGHVREVRALTDLTPLPGAGDLVAGVTNLRGQILVVFDLRGLFGAARGDRDAEGARVVVLGSGRAELGILADAVHEVAVLREDELRPAESLGADGGWDCVRGVTAEGLLVLDGAALLGDPRLFVDQGEEGGT
jgi:purine-binding chemotaxis protein CheW